MQRTIALNHWTRFLPAVLVVAGAGTMAVGLAADQFNLGGPEGIGPRQVSVLMSGLAALLTGVVFIVPVGLRYAAEWLVVGATVVAVMFAADLLVINGLPDFWAKHALFVSVAFATLLAAAPTSTPLEVWRDALAWPRRIVREKEKIGQFLSVTIQLGLLVLLVQQLRLENQAFYHNLMRLAFYGFVIHYLLPIRYRLPFFILLSLAALAGILGFANGAWAFVIGLGLIGICHLPVSYAARVAMLLLAGAVLAALRAEWIPSPWPAVIWPVLASMFMFRLIIYVYDLKHSKAKPTLTSTLSYFFLLPNVVFPFFPVVDYATFRRTYYDEDQYRIYQKGVQWIFRGVLQLIVYRVINYYLVIAPQDVTDTPELIRYLISNFALYVRISGQFHLIIGLLHLFGFNLPPTHILYFLATSFTDLWRRINIYWKDFMLKVFFYPAYFKIKKWGPRASLVVATSFVFLLTWFLHAYQWFWLRGSFLLSAPDILFWLILAVLVVVNTLYEAKRGRKRTLGKQPTSIRHTAGLALRAAGTFSIMALLWSLWSSDSVRDWFSLLAVVDPTVQDVAQLLLAFLVIALLFGIAIRVSTSAAPSVEQAEKRPRSFGPAALTAAPLLILVLASNPAVYSQLGSSSGGFIGDLATNRLSDEEAALLQRGYYEDLIGVNRFNSQLWEIYSKRPADWPNITETEAARHTGDNLIVELVPSTAINFHGARLSTNRWGMRDQEYERTPPPNAYRIALTGPSFAMGFGVADGEVFESILEERLNREHAGGHYARFEILNFAVPGYSAIQNLMIMEQQGLSFQPNALFFIAHQREDEAVVLYLADRMAAGADLPYEELVDLAHSAGVVDGMTKAEAERYLKPHATEILSWTYRRIADVLRAHDVLPVWIFMPTLEYPRDEEQITHLTQVAEKSGFVVLDLSPAYENQDPESLVIAYWDKHPNAKGHILIADQLYQALREKESEIPLGLTTAPEVQ